MRQASKIELTDEQRRERSRSTTTSLRLASSAQIVLLAAKGTDNTEIVQRL